MTKSAAQKPGVTRRKQSCANLLLAAISLAGLTSCGAPSAPLPPSLRLPQSVTDLRAARKGEKVHLVWTAPLQTTDQQLIREAGKMEICRSIESLMVECGAPVGEVELPVPVTTKSQPNPKITQQFVDTVREGLFKNDTEAKITYAVQALNAKGRGAGLSNEVHVVAVLTLPAPDDLRAVVNAQGVTLKWTRENAPTSAKGIRYFYRVYRKGNGTDIVAGEMPISEPPEFLDKAFEWEKKYLYRVTVVTSIAHPGKPETQVEGEDSAEIEVLPHDVFPPAVPSGLQAAASSEGQAFIDLIWSPDADLDLDGYNIYRREDSGEFVKINPRLVKSPAFRDANVQAGETYSYAVSAVDVRGNESERSEAASESVSQ